MYMTYNFIDSINDDSINRLINCILSKANSIDQLHLNISSLGGSVMSAVTAYNFLKSCPFKISTHNLGEVTSAAVIMYLSGSIRTAEKISKFIMHPIKACMNGDLSYYQLQELVQLIDADIKNYASIVNQETNSLNGRYDINECLKGNSITLHPDSAYRCGIVTQMSE